MDKFQPGFPNIDKTMVVYLKTIKTFAARFLALVHEKHLSLWHEYPRQFKRYKHRVELVQILNTIQKAFYQADRTVQKFQRLIIYKMLHQIVIQPAEPERKVYI